MLEQFRSSGVVTAPSPGVVTVPSSGVVIAPSSGVITAPSSGVVTPSSPGVVSAALSEVVVPKKAALPPAISANADGFVLVGARKGSRKKQRSSAVIGTRTGPNELRVMHERTTPVFLSRLGPSETVDNVIAYVKHVQHIEVNCVQLETKHASYSSFKIDVTGTRLTNFLDAKNWPAGAYVRRFFTVKN